jgi:phosphatidylinositol alpha-mannosyltransferase
MKIGLVLPYSIAHGGGVLEIVFAMQAELTRRGHDVYVITPQPRGTDVVVQDHTILIGVSADFHWAPLHTTVQISTSEGDAIDAMLAKHQFDVLHFHEPWVPVIGRQILTRSQTANVATFHGSLPDGIISQAFGKVVIPYTKPLLKYIDEFVATGDLAAEYVCSLTEEPVAIIPVSIDVNTYTPPTDFHDSRKRKTIFYVGRLENRKGPKYLLKAFKLLQTKHPELSLVLGGDGPDRAKLEMLTQDLELQNVTFAGYISNKEKIKYLRTSDLFCAPALYGEGFGLVLLEAMACGLATVAGDNPGYASVMQGLGAISLVNPKHSEDFARRLELLLYQKPLREIWRAWAAAELPQYTYETVVDQYEVIYAKAIAKARARKT